MDLGRNKNIALSPVFDKAIDKMDFDELEDQDYIIEYRASRKRFYVEPYHKNDVNKLTALEDIINTIYWIYDETLTFFYQINERWETMKILLSELENKVLKLNDLFTENEREVIGREFSKAFTEDNIQKILGDKINEGNKENYSRRYTHKDLNTFELEHNESIELKNRLDNIRHHNYAFETFIKMQNILSQIRNEQ